MIRYALKCPSDHAFDSWFQSAQAFDSLNAAGQLACPVCGDRSVGKALMAPQVRAPRGSVETAENDETPRPLATPSTEIEKALAELRRKVEATSEYVGLSFAKEARKMHEGDIPHRSIYGEAKPADAKKLVEDGVPVAPLPFVPVRKTN